MFSYWLRGTDTLSREVTRLEMFYLPSEKGFYSERKEFAPKACTSIPTFQVGLDVHVNKQGVTKDVSLDENWRITYPVCQGPVNVPFYAILSLIC